jgi:hypothetical protein
LPHRAIVFGLIAIWIAMSQYDAISPRGVPTLSVSSDAFRLIMFAIASIFVGRATDYFSALFLWTVLPFLQAATLFMAVSGWHPLLLSAQIFAQYLWIFREICLARFLITFFKPREFFLAYGIAEMFRTFGMGQAFSHAYYSAPFTWQALLVGHAFSMLMWLGPWLLWTWPQFRAPSRLREAGAADWRKFLGSKAVWLCVLSVPGLIYFGLVLEKWAFKTGSISGPISEILASNRWFFAAILGLFGCAWLQRSLCWLNLERAVRPVLVAAALIGVGGMVGCHYWNAISPAIYVLGLVALNLFYSIQTGLLLTSAGRNYTGVAVGMSIFIPSILSRWVPLSSGSFGEGPKGWETGAACASLVLVACLLALASKDLSRA